MKIFNPKQLALAVSLAITANHAFAVANGVPIVVSNFGNARTVAVHLFEWKWKDVAKVCETTLGPNGFAAVQISPPNEHALIQDPKGSSNFPWYQRYQPVSYKLNSRSGTEAELQNMITRCNAAGVDVYADAVINHMTNFFINPIAPSNYILDASNTKGLGSAGSTFTKYDYPALGFNSSNFHACMVDIYDYPGNANNNVRDCELGSLADLNTGQDSVRTIQAAYLTKLFDMGVKGFRIDGAKHINPEEIGKGDINDGISGVIEKVNQHADKAGKRRPYFYLEVIDKYGGEAIKWADYTDVGTNFTNASNPNADLYSFRYGIEVKAKAKAGGEGIRKLVEFNLDSTWVLNMPGERAIVFTTNHDEQRKGSEVDYTSFKHKEYVPANVFMLGWPYGYPHLMSSYNFNNTLVNNDTVGHNDGPPSDNNGNTNDVYNAQGVAQCLSPSSWADNAVKGWACEHQHPAILGMVGFRNITNGVGVNQGNKNLFSNYQVVGFSRGNVGDNTDKGYVVINNTDDHYDALGSGESYTSALPDGEYCDVIHSRYAYTWVPFGPSPNSWSRAHKCVELTSTNTYPPVVVKSGKVSWPNSGTDVLANKVPPRSAIAIHVGAKIN